MTWDSVKQIVSENSSSTAIEAIDILLRYCNNIINNPSEQKYRRIRLKNALVERKLLPCIGAIECLFDMGFLEDGEFLTMPHNCSLSVLSVIRNELQAVRQSLLNPGSGEPPISSAPLVPAPNTPPVSQNTSPTNRNYLALEAKFFAKLNSSLQHVLIYEDQDLQDKARSVIPLSNLLTEAREKQESIQSMDNSATIDLQDCLILCLLDWFKNSFFSWVDAPECERCGGQTTPQGMVTPTAEEQKWGAGRVESYRCNVCSAITRFPRYNHPRRLLDTRRGRCGEWANCFTLCCRSVGLEARYVLDWTDHVWTEVYSQGEKRWLHCDPCENVCDKPLLYETGWHKKLTYVMAFSKDEVADVSWRYSAHHADMRARRTECREEWLVNTVYQMNKAKRAVMPPARQAVMLNRTVAELVEFLTEKNSDVHLSGRTTGSMAWRLARGEAGSTIKQTAYVITPTETEKQSKRIHLAYNCAKDYYERYSNHCEEVRCWQSLCFESASVLRKEEKDWKMVYLARMEGSSSASISWKIDLKDSNLRIEKMRIRAETAVYESGVIQWSICSGDHCIMLNRDKLSSLTPVEVEGSKSVTLTANLSRGTGNVAWQHTQLFRQSSTDLNKFPFEIDISLS